MESRISKEIIGSNIKTLAKYYGFNISDIEKEANVSTGYLSRITCNRNSQSSPLIDLLLVASQIFHVSIDSLVSLDFKKLANPEKMRLQCFLEALLTLTNRDQIKWERCSGREICTEEYASGFFCKYDKDICFYIFEFDFEDEDFPGYTVFISNKDSSPSQVAKYNLPGPAAYETLRQIFESAASSTEFVTISDDADAAIRKFMFDNRLIHTEAYEQNKYKSLHDYLLMHKEDDLVLTFSQIEDILGFPLPPSARKHRTFWENDKQSHNQSSTWMSAGFKVVDANANTIEERVHFQRINKS